ncbi:unnamed protein product [Microthlaspi erraticum]|uniref:Retrovirus-related Pol polyprotein from transposon TNT 1-94-like beta-barrel domain-containing protein n=1 Tax=Microthlaspi erraticum TaxID=1685480 RepID=A0A6D2LIP1_9BRAS|nr:unnamed protein product [Microthlaspi erraticum]
MMQMWLNFATNQKAGLTLTRVLNKVANQAPRALRNRPKPPIPKEEIWILREVQSLWQGWTSRSRLSQQGQGEKPSQLDRTDVQHLPEKQGDDRLLMGNVSHSKIEGTGKVVLKMTSGRELTLNNVKHVPDMRKNLISGTLMSKHGFAINFESDQLILRKMVFL